VLKIRFVYDIFGLQPDIKMKIPPISRDRFTKGYAIDVMVVLDQKGLPMKYGQIIVVGQLVKV
jgi:hypothetical protein